MNKRKLGKLVLEGTQLDYEERVDEVHRQFKLKQAAATSSLDDNESIGSLESLKVSNDQIHVPGPSLDQMLAEIKPKTIFEVYQEMKQNGFKKIQVSGQHFDQDQKAEPAIDWRKLLKRLPKDFTMPERVLILQKLRENLDEE